MTINKGEPFGLRRCKMGNLCFRNPWRHFIRKRFNFDGKVKDLSSMRPI